MKTYFNITLLIALTIVSALSLTLPLLPQDPDTPTARILPKPPVSVGVFVRDSNGTPVPMMVQELDVSVAITGTIATTTLDITVFNPHDRVLEGEFVFPLTNGQTVSRFALDINGKLRDAVVVDKSKGRSTFEEVIRTKVDPALLEWTRDNSFKARIYPLPAKGTRRIVIAYEQLLTSVPEGLGYTIPFAYTSAIPKFNFHATVTGFGSTPSLTGGSADTMFFSPHGRNYTIGFSRANVLLTTPFTIMVPVALSQHRVVVEEHKGDDYAAIFLNTGSDVNTRRLPVQPRSVTILWDASISGTKRNIPLELEYLKQLMNTMRPASITVLTFAHTILTKQEYSLADSQLIVKTLSSLPMDGATQLGVLPLRTLTSDIAFLFSDGISTFGNEQIQDATVPVYCITSASPADFPVLNSIAVQSGGELIDLTVLSLHDAIETALQQHHKIMSVSVIDGRMTDILPSSATVSNGVTVVCGRLLTSSATVRITTGFDNSSQQTHTITISKHEHGSEGTAIPRRWATMMIERLSINRSGNADAIRDLGTRFNLVTPGTSLIVLDRIEDYLRFNIKPPESEPELVALFQERIAAYRQDSVRAIQERHTTIEKTLNSVRTAAKPSSLPANSGTFWIWPEAQPLPNGISVREIGSVTGKVTDEKGVALQNKKVTILNTGFMAVTDATGTYTFTGIPHGVYSVIADPNGGSGTARSTVIVEPGKVVRGNIIQSRVRITDLKASDVVGRAATRNGAATIGLPAPAAYGGAMERLSVSDESAMVSGVDAAVVSDNFQMEMADATTPDRHSAEPSSNINLVPGKPTEHSVSREVWTESLDRATTADQVYAVYVQLRNHYFESTGLYLDAADALIQHGNKPLALRVLLSLAEIQSEDARTLRILAHRLLQLGYPQHAVHVFRDVLRIRDEEPQSYRDLALAFAATGEYHQAASLLTSIITRPWHNRFPEIEVIAARELGRLALQPGASNIQIPAEYRIPVNTDLRVVLTWDADNCDMDLWVTDPDGEVCMYNNRDTKLGGHLTRDFTGGYGPEEFVLPNAKKGAYKIQVNYYGSRQQTIERPTTVQVDMFTGYGTAAEQHTATTLRVNQVSRIIDVGTILVN